MLFRSGRSVGDTMHGAILIGLGICAVPIGRLNALVRRIIEMHHAPYQTKTPIFIIGIGICAVPIRHTNSPVCSLT